MRMIDNYNDLPVGKWEEINRIIAECDGEVTEYSPKVLAVLCEMTEEEMLNLPILEYSDLTRRAAFLCEEPPVAPIADKYTFCGHTFAITKDLRTITAAQYIDFMTYVGREDSTCADILSCFILPEGHAYNDGYDVTTAAQVIRNFLSVPEALGLVRFFSACAMTSARAIVESSARTIRRLARKEKDKTRKEVLLEKTREMREAANAFSAIGLGLRRLTLSAGQCGSRGRKRTLWTFLRSWRCCSISVRKQQRRSGNERGGE